MEIPVKYFADIDHIQTISIGDWIDLRAAKDYELKAGELKFIYLGIGMILPKGYEAHIVPRSSTTKNFGVMQANSVGIIDNSFCGDNDQWGFCAYAIRDTFIPKNSRICQFRIVENQSKIHFREVEHLGNSDRGGFGSTGVV